MLLFIPGRHHLATQFQFEYLNRLTTQGIEAAEKLLCNDSSLPLSGKVDGIIFAITSSNHQGTKRNPLPFYLRSLIFHELGKAIPVPAYIYGINDVGVIDEFAQFSLKTVDHQSGNRFDLTPANTVVVCSTPVLKGYLQLGYRIATAELGSNDLNDYAHRLPWSWVEELSESPAGLDGEKVQTNLHESSLGVWRDYQLVEQVREILNDPIIGDDGDLTETRDYGSYVRGMDEIAMIKFNDTARYIRPGRVGDIGCAVGSWIKLACKHPPLHESDFYGIEVARQLFDLCQQRKLNGEFENPSVFFNMKNAVAGLCFKPESMDTIHTGSLTHEIESYGSREELLAFIENRYAELKPQGVWINRDVIGPEDGDRDLLMWLDDQDGLPHSSCDVSLDQVALGDWLNTLSTRGRFFQFAEDFRKKEGESVDYEQVEIDGRQMLRLSYRDASEFLLTKDYTGNWESEMHERFCFWSFRDWKSHLEKIGFQMHVDSKAYQNPWIVDNRLKGRAELVDATTQEPLGFPPTNVLIVAQKR